MNDNTDLLALDKFILRAQLILARKGKTEEQRAFDEYAIRSLEVVRDAIRKMIEVKEELYK